MADGKDGFACSRCAVYDGYAFLLGAALLNVFLFLLETLVNRLNRFILIGCERFERREFKQVSVLEFFDGVNRVVVFAQLCSQRSELLAILRPLKVIELSIAIIAIGYLVFFVSANSSMSLFSNSNVAD